MPVTMALATCATSRGLIAAEMRSVSGGFSAFSASKPGVRVSGG